MARNAPPLQGGSSREAITPVAQSGCYGWFIWVNAAKPCVSPRIVDRPVSDDRMFPSLPADLYQFAGLFGQLVTVFPSEGLIVARFGQDNGGTIGVPPWEEEFYGRVLAAITDKPVDMPKPDPDASDVSREDLDRGFFDAAQNPDEAQGGAFPETLPPKGPPRARAALIELPRTRPSADGELTSPPALPARVAVRPAPWLQGPRAPERRGRHSLPRAPGQGEDTSLRAAPLVPAPPGASAQARRPGPRTQQRPRPGRGRCT